MRTKDSKSLSEDQIEIIGRMSCTTFVQLEGEVKRWGLDFIDFAFVFGNSPNWIKNTLQSDYSHDERTPAELRAKIELARTAGKK